MRTTLAVTSGLVASVLNLPATAAAQRTVKTFDRLNSHLKVGNTVRVTDIQGQEVKGERTVALHVDGQTPTLG